MTKKYFFALISVVFCAAITTTTQAQHVNLIDQQLYELMPNALDLHKDFVSLPNDAQFKEAMIPNAKWLQNAFGKRGFDVSLLDSPTDIPLVFAHKMISADLPTVLIYLHYDGQPVDASEWAQDDPFIPVVKTSVQSEAIAYEQVKASLNPDFRIFARAAADDKGPIIMLLTALDLLKQRDEDIAFNLKILFDGEEEKGSEGLKQTLDRYAELYAADHIIIMDGPAHPSNEPTITFGCRGIASATLTVYGAVNSQHSGHYGNYAPNPAFRLSTLMSSMKDDKGRVRIEGYYDGIEITEVLRKQLSEVPDNTESINTQLGIAQAEAVGGTYQESLQYPSLNIRGMSAAWTGSQKRTIVPDKAVAELDLRLVVESDGDRLLGLVKAHIEQQGYVVLDREPTLEERLTHPKIATFTGAKSVNAFRTAFESETGLWLTNAMETTFGKKPIRIRTMGGTVPVVLLIEKLQAPAVILPLVNMDNNQHSPNENLRLGNFMTGIKACYGMLTTPI